MRRIEMCKPWVCRAILFVAAIAYVAEHSLLLGSGFIPQGRASAPGPSVSRLGNHSLQPVEGNATLNFAPG